MVVLWDPGFQFRLVVLRHYRRQLPPSGRRRSLRCRGMRWEGELFSRVKKDLFGRHSKRVGRVR